MQESIPTSIGTLGALKASGYKSISIKEELRKNLIRKLRAGEDVFPGIYGYEDTVIPDLERAILSRHNVLLLGLRGQAKTRIARMMVHLLDEYIPAIAGTDLNDDPFNPLSRQAKDIIAENGDDTLIVWIHRKDRYAEKLATPDVSVADLIGDVDPIKAANLRLAYSNERVIHFGLIPRANRSIFVINELPDLQPRIQVALFNILQEGDIQIRGFKLRLQLDIQFVFTANPEDYTNRGSIVTPLKDRIESQILTHYPKSIEISRQITEQEANISSEAQKRVFIPEVMRDLVEQVSVEARKSEYVDQKSGVSARLTITALENLVSAAELRALINNEESVYARIGDLWGIIPSLTGKIELVYEGEQEGPAIVAQNLLGKAIRSRFAEFFPDPEQAKRKGKDSPYTHVAKWFGSGNTADLMSDLSNKQYADVLNGIPGLKDLVKRYFPRTNDEEQLFLMEFVLHGMAEFSLIGKNRLERGLQFQDLMSGLFSKGGFDNDEELDEEPWDK